MTTPDSRPYFFRRYPRISLAGIGLLLFFFCFALIEGSLRLAGQEPGQLRSTTTTDFKPVDSLVVFNDFIADQQGVFHVNTARRPAIRRAILKGRSDTTSAPLRKLLATLVRDFNDPVVDLASRLSAQTTATLADTAASNLQRAYRECPINADGFRSPPFRPYSGPRTSVLLLGDSFTWGMAARPITASFADRLRDRGYLCHNAGIPGADPAQYLALAEQLIPRLRPDVVVINFYLGNDPVHYLRTPSAGEPLWHDTNAGWLMAHPYGCYLNAKEAYAFNSRLDRLPVAGNRRINAWYAKTVLTTRLWEALRAYDLVSAWFGPPCDLDRSSQPGSEAPILRIAELAAAYDALPLLVIIPEISDSLRSVDEVARANFPTFAYHLVPTLEAGDYHADDPHFNHRGHAKYTDFLDRLIPVQMAIRNGGEKR